MMKRFFYTILTGLILVGMLSFGALAATPEDNGETAQTFPAAIEDVFPDEALAAAVAEELNRAVTATVTRADLEMIESLAAEEVEDLTGIQYLTSLTELELTEGEIEDISHLAALVDLEYLNLSDNEISDIEPLEELTALVELNLEGNRVSDLTPLEGLEDLESLNLAYNAVFDISPLYELGLEALYLQEQDVILAPAALALPFVKENVLLNLDGSFIDPWEPPDDSELLGISHDGEYEEPYFTWEELPVDVEYVYYRFHLFVELENEEEVLFAGMVTQPISGQHTVTFRLQGGNIDGNEINPTQSVLHGASPVNIPANLQRNAHLFLGWSRTEMGPVIRDWASEGITADTDFFARWQSIHSVTVTFSAAGALPATQSGPVSPGGTYAAILEAITPPSRLGHEFVGWFTAPTGGVQITPASIVIPAANHTLFAQWRWATVSPGDVPFTDIQNHPAREAIEMVFIRGLMSGTSATTFAPDTSLSRGMAVVVLWRMAGEPTATFRPIFQDVRTGQVYTTAIMWAADVGIVRGHSNGTFGPGDEITREQLATILHRYALYAGYARLVPAMVNLGQFTDRADISPWALEAMRWTVHTEILAGTSNTALSPQEGLNRAQCAVVLQRFFAAFG